MLFRDLPTQNGAGEFAGEGASEGGEGEMQMSNSQESFTSAVSTNAAAFETRMAELYSPSLLTPSWARDDVLYFPTVPQNMFSDAALASGAGPAPALGTAAHEATTNGGTMSYTASVTSASRMSATRMAASLSSPTSHPGLSARQREQEAQQQQQLLLAAQDDRLDETALQADMYNALCGLGAPHVTNTTSPPSFFQQQVQQQVQQQQLLPPSSVMLLQAADPIVGALAGQTGAGRLGGHVVGYDKVHFIPYPSLDELQAMRMATSSSTTTTPAAAGKTTMMMMNNELEEMHQGGYYEGNTNTSNSGGAGGAMFVGQPNASSLPGMNGSGNTAASPTNSMFTTTITTNNNNNNNGNIANALIRPGMAESPGTASAGLLSGSSSLAHTPASLSTCVTPYLRGAAAPTIKLFIGGLRFEIVHAGRHAVRWIFEASCQVRLQVNHILIHRKAKTGQRNSPHSVTPTGCASVFVTNEPDAVALLAMHQRIYCAREGIYVAESASAMREFMLRENPVTYKGKIRGPTHPMVIERATSTGGMGHNTTPHTFAGPPHGMPHADPQGTVPGLPMVMMMPVMNGDVAEDTLHTNTITNNNNHSNATMMTASSSLASESGCYAASATANAAHSARLQAGHMAAVSHAPPPPAYGTSNHAAGAGACDTAASSLPGGPSYAQAMTASALQSLLLPHGPTEALMPYNNNGNNNITHGNGGAAQSVFPAQPVTVGTRPQQHNNSNNNTAQRVELGCALRFVPLPSEAALAEFAEAQASALSRPHSHTSAEESHQKAACVNGAEEAAEKQISSPTAEERSASLVTLFVGGLAPGSSPVLVSWLFAHFDLTVPPSQVALLLTPCAMALANSSSAAGVQPCAVVQLPASAVGAVMAYHRRVLCTSQGVWFASSVDELATVMANEPSFADYYAFHVERRLGALNTTSTITTNTASAAAVSMPPPPTPCAALPFPAPLSSAHTLALPLPPPPPPLMPPASMLSQYGFPAPPSLAVASAACVPRTPSSGLGPTAPPAYQVNRVNAAKGSARSNTTNTSWPSPPA